VDARNKRLLGINLTALISVLFTLCFELLRQRITSRAPLFVSFSFDHLVQEIHKRLKHLCAASAAPPCYLELPCSITFLGRSKQNNNHVV
jgi:hypothetical protein